MPFDLVPTLIRAIRLYGGQGTGVFSSETFASAVREEFELAEAPDDAWCARVLLDRRDVVRFKGHDIWRLIDPLKRSELIRCP